MVRGRLVRWWMMVRESSRMVDDGEVKWWDGG